MGAINENSGRHVFVGHDTACSRMTKTQYRVSACRRLATNGNEWGIKEKRALLQRDATRDETRSFKDASSTPFRWKKYIYIFFSFYFACFLKKHRRTRDKKSKILRYLFYGMNICKIFKEISAKSYSKFERRYQTELN